MMKKRKWRLMFDIRHAQGLQNQFKDNIRSDKTLTMDYLLYRYYEQEK
jgi:hypothetical protein